MLQTQCADGCPAGQIGGEHCVDDAQLTQLNAAPQADADHHVTVVAATGDTGAAGEPCALIDALDGSMSGFIPRKEVGLVASDPLVLSVGGTTLDASHTTGAWIGETAWGLPDGSPGSSPGIGRRVTSGRSLNTPGSPCDDSKVSSVIVCSGSAFASRTADTPGSMVSTTRPLAPNGRNSSSRSVCRPARPQCQPCRTRQ